MQELERKKTKKTQLELETKTSGAIFLLLAFYFNASIMPNYLLDIKKNGLNHILNNTYFLCLIIFFSLNIIDFFYNSMFYFFKFN
jgi:hypothetical protein